MPFRPKRPCSTPGCQEFAAPGRGKCARHAKEADDARKARFEACGRKRGNSYLLYRTAQWKALRASFLRCNPFCASCARRGTVEPATVVDHIVPHKGDAALFYDAGNLQGLCKPCHDRKTAREDGGFGNRRQPARA